MRIKIEEKVKVSALNKFLIKAVLFYIFITSFYYFIVQGSQFESSFINYHVYLSAKTLNIFGFKSIYNFNILSIEGGGSAEILAGCNYFSYLGIFLNFFISYPGNFKRALKYIVFCLLSLSVFSIIRIISFAIVLKYKPGIWDVFHQNSSYIFYYPIIMVQWYMYSLNENENIF